jgi:hypothetical protein
MPNPPSMTHGACQTGSFFSLPRPSSHALANTTAPPGVDARSVFRFLPHRSRGGQNEMSDTLDYADHDEDDAKRKSSRTSPEEGHRLVRLFLSVERADLREEIFNFVEEILARQGQLLPLVGSSTRLPLSIGRLT